MRENLRELIATINRTARALAFDTPGLESKFRLPRVNNDQALLNAARAFAADAAPLKAAFLKLEMPADFLARLNQLSADFEQTTTEKATAVGRARRRQNLARRSRRARLTSRPLTQRRHPQQIQRRPRCTGELDARQPRRLPRPQHCARAAADRTR